MADETYFGSGFLDPFWRERKVPRFDHQQERPIGIAEDGGRPIVGFRCNCARRFDIGQKFCEYVSCGRAHSDNYTVPGGQA